MKPAMPVWITVVTSFICALGLFVSGSLYVSPAAFIPDTDFSQSSVQFLTQMWAARQLAISLTIGCALIYAHRRRAPLALLFAFLPYSLMNWQDVAIGLLRADTGLAAGSAVFGTLSATIIFTLSRRLKT